MDMNKFSKKIMKEFPKKSGWYLMLAPDENNIVKITYVGNKLWIITSFTNTTKYDQLKFYEDREDDNVLYDRFGIKFKEIEIPDYEEV